jgi:Rad3-related DNA helicase
MIRLPVRQLVERVMRSGDIDGGYVSRERMLEGAIAHRYLQKKNKEINDSYRSEVALSVEYEHEDLIYSIEGRADGIFIKEGICHIDEIKTTHINVKTLTENHDLTHWAQAKCYGYIFCAQNKMAKVGIQLTYHNIEDKETRTFVKIFGSEELEMFVEVLVERYSEWERLSLDWKELRNQSIKCLKFPFHSYRPGQRALAVAAYRTIEENAKIYVQAPTGIGKTISTLFPAIKAMGEEKTGKLFYLTAKTITRQVAEEAFGKMRSQGLKIKTITLTAKEKICFMEKTICKPNYCKYAKGHYDRVDDCMLEALREWDEFSRNVVEKYAQKHMVCPFELSLDLSLMSDCIICDYNYVFDPRAYLRRYFSGGESDHVFLVDEAHNLVDRSREMFSASISKTELYGIKKEFKGQNSLLDKILKNINKFFLDFGKRCESGNLIQRDRPDDFLSLMENYAAICEQMLKERKGLSEEGEFLKVYFSVLGFLSVGDLYDERYVTFVQTESRDVVIKLFCINPTRLLAEAFDRGKSSVLFSATFTPLGYFKDLLGGGEEDKTMSLGSPFDEDNLCIIAADKVSTKYHQRQESIGDLCDIIEKVVSKKTGNYMAYFPSYKYMADVYKEFTTRYPELKSLSQESSMSEAEREIFLDCFKDNPKESLVAFCVLGGIFSEGIDLVGSRLIGAIIISVGLPRLNVQQDIIKDHFNKKNNKGYEYAYMYPGMNKVLQAAGRVIRCEKDKGVVVLVDERYGHRNYKELFPSHWRMINYVGNCSEVDRVLDEFWNK